MVTIRASEFRIDGKKLKALLTVAVFSLIFYIVITSRLIGFVTNFTVSNLQIQNPKILLYISVFIVSFIAAYIRQVID